MSCLLLKVALPVPLRRSFDYLCEEPKAEVGCRVKVPFGARHLVGIVTHSEPLTEPASERLKSVEKVLDSEPLIEPGLYQFLEKSAHYYHHFPGEVLLHALPPLLRKGEPAQHKPKIYWQLSPKGESFDISTLKRAPKQQQALMALMDGPVHKESLSELNINGATLKALREKGLCQSEALEINDDSWHVSFKSFTPETLIPNVEQQLAIETISQQLGQFSPILLEGVTGSGKTEVYLRILEQVLSQGQQALILVPEIGLTPQTVQRFKRRFNVPVLVQHSAMNERERLNVWLKMRDGSGALLIGTRSALFTPARNLGLIIIDEEHDNSFKQQDGFRYHGRDLAVLRAKLENIPILLGSATPSLETIYNAEQGRYRHLTLTERAGDAAFADQHLLNIRGVQLTSGLSPQLITLISEHLGRGEQVLLFLNRRGYAPSLLCHQCGWVAQCPHCDIPLTLHQGQRRLICHHCDYRINQPYNCPQCHQPQLMGSGLGTEQVEQALKQLYPQYQTIRIDRDTTRRKGELEEHLEGVVRKEYQILLGTQMLAKGHHFPDVTLVALLDVDSALFSPDFRAQERLSQLITQVAGRAGRSDKPGTVLLQTHHPEHPLLQDLISHNHALVIRELLNERQQSMLPPYSYQVLLRAEAFNAEDAIRFLEEACGILHPAAVSIGAIQLLGPMPAPMEKRAGRYRYLLLLQASQRQPLARLLSHTLEQLDKLKRPNQLRWSLDVDPQEWI
ncbi:primosomal protein N' [Dongshaea marina]|uniref:primosomal protein N' n=1 Tax=Dongshaea marina TaxID=2047966 RepID=UPI000D3EABFA|nr:primosomal protein N' [Dongshaea marina]